MTKKKNDDNELFKSLLKLNIRYAIEDSNINIRMIDNRIKSYQTLIDHLEDNKPSTYEKNSLKEFGISTLSYSLSSEKPFSKKAKKSIKNRLSQKRKTVFSLCRRK